jgi:hypothetical protein
MLLPSVKWSLASWLLTATWILVLEPPRDWPSAWESYPFLRLPRVGGHERSSSQAIGLIIPRRPQSLGALVLKHYACTHDRIVYRWIPWPNSFGQVSVGNTGACNLEHDI